VAPLSGQNDTTSASIGSRAIPVTLKGVGDTATLGFVVRYELKSAPLTKIGSTQPAVFIGNSPSTASPVDTTEADGASRNLYVRTALLADPLVQSGQKVDSAVVLVTTSYKGLPVSGSPIRVVIPIKGKLGP
jgi:hypothetical protein